MLRFGIVTKSEIPTERIGDVMPAVALTLLPQFKVPLSQKEEAQLAYIFASLDATPVSRMKTFPDRYRELDGLIAARIAGGKPIRVHDMAASNAITSLELFERLTGQFGDGVSLLASDYFDRLHAVRLSRSGWTTVFGAHGHPLQFVGRRMVISAARERKRYPVNQWLRRSLTRSELPRAAEHLKANGGEIERISLFHPRCLETARRNSQFKLGQDDACNPRHEPVDVLRIMNLPEIESPEAIKDWLQKAGRNVIDGGLLVLGNARDGHRQIAATVFRRQGQRFAALADLLGGFTRRQAVVELLLAQPAA